MASVTFSTKHDKINSTVSGTGEENKQQQQKTLSPEKERAHRKEHIIITIIVIIINTPPSATHAGRCHDGAKVCRMKVFGAKVCRVKVNGAKVNGPSTQDLYS